MSYHTDDLQLASDFLPVEGEANFGPTLTREVVGGTHIAPHCITIQNGEYVLIDWLDGLPRHDLPGVRSMRFPHGLMHFGETLDQCADRLVASQMGLEVMRSSIVHIYSQVDSTNHWHLEPILVTEVGGTDAPAPNAQLVRVPVSSAMPGPFTWRGKPPYSDLYDEYVGPYLGGILGMKIRK